MTDTGKILQALERLEAGQQALQTDVKSLQEGQKLLQAPVENQGKRLRDSKRDRRPLRLISSPSRRDKNP
jgi:hypothetical protein